MSSVRRHGGAAARPSQPPHPDLVVWAGRLIIVLLALVYAGSTLWRTPLRGWAETAIHATMDAGGPNLPLRAAASIVSELTIPARPLALAVRGVLLAALVVLLFEALAAYLAAAARAERALRSATTFYRARTLHPANRTRFPAIRHDALWRAIVRAFVGQRAGQIALTLSRAPNAPAMLGVQLRGDPAGSPAPQAVAPERVRVRARPRLGDTVHRRAERGPVRRLPEAAPVTPTAGGAVDELRRSLLGILRGADETVQLEAWPDPLAAAAQPGAVLLEQELALAAPPAWMLRPNEDGDSAILRHLTEALAVPEGLLLQEIQTIIDPIGTDDGRRWLAVARWWAARLSGGRHGQRAAREQEALAAKIQDSHVAVTVRLVALVRSAAPADIAAGRRSLGVMSRALSDLGADYQRPLAGTIRQRLIPLGAPRQYAVGDSAPATPPALRWLRRAAHLTGALVILALLALLGAAVARGYHGVAGVPTWADLPAWARLAATALAGAHAGLAAALGLWLTALAAPWAVLRRVGRQRAGADPMLAVRPLWAQPDVLACAEAAQLWHLPDASSAQEICWLPNRILPAPPGAFLPEPDTAKGARGRLGPQSLQLGTAPDSGGRWRPVGLLLRALHQMMHVLGPMGAGKSQLATSLTWQLIPYGLMVLDGKGDDEGGGLAAILRRHVGFEEEHRLFYLDVLETAFPIGLNPIYHLMEAMERATSKADHDLAFNQALGLVLGLFERLDPGRWRESPGMQQFALMGSHLVLRTGSSKAGEVPTMAKIARALEDESYRKVLLERYPLKNDSIFRFWTERESALSEAQKSSLQALLRRLDLFLTNPITRPMLTVEKPSIDLRQAMDEGHIVLIPMPHRKLGGLAPMVAMLVLQSIVAAAYAREGDALSRTTAPVFIDEVQVFIVDDRSPDLEQAFTQLRGFAVPLIVLNQTDDQLGDLATTIRANAANRLLLRTEEPDASMLAKMYSSTGMTAADLQGMEPPDHQYAVTLGPNRERLAFSIRPNPWPAPLVQTLPVYRGPRGWQELAPPLEPGTPEALRERYERLDRLIADLIYAELDPAAFDRMTGQLALLPQAMWDVLLERWEQVRVYHRQYILDNPGVIPDQLVRQTWLTRLVASRGALIEEALTLRQELQMAGLAGALLATPAPTPGTTPLNLGAAEPTPSDDLTQFTQLPDTDAVKRRRGKASKPGIREALSPRDGDESGGGDGEDDEDDEDDEDAAATVLVRKAAPTSSGRQRMSLRD